MALTLTRRTDGRFAILELNGELTLGPHLRTFGAGVTRLLTAKNCSGVLLNLAGLSKLDSAGIGELVKIHSQSIMKKIPVALVAPTARVREILATTRVDALFHFAPDEQSAMRELK